MTDKQHGIVIVKHKHYYTKKVYNNGYIMRIYRRCPFGLTFKSAMINDRNQDYCGGWSMSGVDGSIAGHLERVTSGQKPMVEAYGVQEEIIAISKSIVKKKYDCLIHDGHWNDRHSFLIMAIKGKMKDLFDLEALKSDYHNNGIPIDIEPIKNKRLKDYFAGWVNHGQGEDPWGLWETGLILGYPIENTISIYRQ